MSSPPSVSSFCLGWLSDLKHSSNYGFISFADRPGEIFFHFSELKPAFRSALQSASPGQEVKFIEKQAKGRSFASEVEFLPKGSIASEIIVTERASGNVERELRMDGDGEGFGGLIRLSSPASDSFSPSVPSVLQFSERDLISPAMRKWIRNGDSVQFSVFQERKSGRFGATRVSLLALSSADRYSGVVVSVKDSFGFIRTKEKIADKLPKGKSDIFFHFSELIRAGDLSLIGGSEVKDASESVREPAIGDCFQFTLVTSQSGASASRLTPLPPGSVKLDQLQQRVRDGTILQSWASGGQNGEWTPGQIQFLNDANESVTIPLIPSDCRAAPHHGAPMLLRGDRVQFQLLECSDGSLLPRQVALVKGGESQSDRMQGIVSLVRDGFAFIECDSQKDRVFISQRHLKTPLTVGMELEFSLFQESPGKVSAVRPVMLPLGTVQFEIIKPGLMEGIVVNQSQSNAKKAIQVTASEIKQSEQSETQGENQTNNTDKDSIAIGSILPVASSSSLLILPGDRVRFRVSYHKQSRVSSAVEIEMIQENQNNRERGKIISIQKEKDKNSPINGKLLAEKRAKPLPFCCPAESEAFAVGDYVSFAVAPLATPGAPNARAIDTAIRMQKLAEEFSLEHSVSGSCQGRIAAPPKGGKGGKVVIEKCETEAAAQWKDKQINFLAQECSDEVHAGDLVSFSLVARTGLPEALPRAVKLAIVPLDAIVSEIKGQNGGILTVRGATVHASEQLVFSPSDVTSDRPLQIGDWVSIGALGQSQGKKRTAKAIKFVKSTGENLGAAGAPAVSSFSLTSANSASAAVVQSRFSQGPPSDPSNIGFQRRRTQARHEVAIKLKSAPS